MQRYQMRIKKAKHLYFTYPYHQIMPLNIIHDIDGEDLINQHIKASKLARSTTFKVLTSIKVLALVFLPLLLLNYLASFLPFNFGDDTGWGVLDIIFALFIIWDIFKTYQAINNYYPNLISEEIKNRVMAFNKTVQQKNL